MQQNLNNSNTNLLYNSNSFKTLNKILSNDSLEIYDERKKNDLIISIPDTKNLNKLKQIDNEYIKYSSDYIYIESEKDIINMINSSEKNLFIHKLEDNSDLITEKTSEGDDISLNNLFNKIESEFTLHKLIFEKDYRGIENLLEKFISDEELLTKILNQFDFRKNTPLMLCIILRSQDKCDSYLNIMNVLFKYTFLDPKIRNFDNWLPIEIATSNNDIESVRLIYYYMLKRRQLKIIRNIKKLSKFLLQIPDFYFEMKWEVNVPLISSFCPNDVCKIHKCGSKVRLDFTFIQFKNLSCVRAPSSYIFTEDINYIINHKTKSYYSPHDELEEDEIRLILDDIMNSNRFDGEFKLKSCELLESKTSWTKKSVVENVNGWQSQKYEVNIIAFVNIHNKMKFEYLNLNKYTYWDEKVSLDKNVTVILDEKDMKKQLANNLNMKNDAIKNQLLKMGNNKDKKLRAFIWVSNDFPIAASSLITLLNSISGANEFTKKIMEFLNNEDIKKVIEKGGFPIKIKIPFTLFIDVTATFTSFKKLSPFEINSDVFTIPSDYTRLSRKKAQDLKNNAKKRLAFANIL